MLVSILKAGMLAKFPLLDSVENDLSDVSGVVVVTGS